MNNSDIPEIWDKLLKEVDRQKEKPAYAMWVRTAMPQSLSNNTMEIMVEKPFIKEWLEDKYLTSLEESLSSICQCPMTIKILCPTEQPESSSREEAAPTVKLATTAPKPVQKETFQSNLVSKYDFDNFVIGNSNRFAHAAALAVAEAPAKVYNPLFLYSSSGLGKTHLMHAIGNRIQQNNPDMKILYISSETFTNEMINSIQNNAMEAFRNKYRNIDVLLIDDIQFLRKKESTQEEFFHTFEALHRAEKQIIISSDRKPSELDTLEERLTSRFGWGLITDIQPPDLETRMAILHNMAKKSNLNFPDDVILLMASSIENNIRELEGAYTKVLAYANFFKQPITLELAQKALKDFNLDNPNKTVTVESIQQLVASKYKIKMDDFLAKKRTRNVAFPRQIAMYLCRELTDYSLPRIGDFFGGRDHTTVIHACEKISKEMKNDPHFEKSIKEMESHLKK
jgi:chromosomal replication initiator protein